MLQILQYLQNLNTHFSVLGTFLFPFVPWSCSVTCTFHLFMGTRLPQAVNCRAIRVGYRPTNSPRSHSSWQSHNALRWHLCWSYRWAFLKSPSTHTQSFTFLLLLWVWDFLLYSLKKIWDFINYYQVFKLKKMSGQPEAIRGEHNPENVVVLWRGDWEATGVPSLSNGNIFTEKAGSAVLGEHLPKGLIPATKELVSV